MYKNLWLRPVACQSLTHIIIIGVTWCTSFKSARNQPIFYLPKWLWWAASFKCLQYLGCSITLVWGVILGRVLQAIFLSYIRPPCALLLTFSLPQVLVSWPHTTVSDRVENVLSSVFVKVWVFWEVQKIRKKFRRTFDKSVVFCARNSVLVKKSTKIFQNKCGQVVLYKLWKISQQFIILKWLDPLAPGCGDPGSF